MKSLFAGLLVALLIAAVALIVAAAGSVGVAAIGLLLHNLFDLSQWQGTLVALIVTLGLGYLVYKLAAQPSVSAWEPDWEDWEPEAEDVEEKNEPPVVPWRRNRPTPGELPSQKPAPPGPPPAGRKRK